ncbi:MAG: MraY family glycosyltransferase, partial [Pseudomonadota bacterium]
MKDLGWLFVAALTFSLSIVAVYLNHVSVARRNDIKAIQAVHLRSTSRFGGVAIFLAWSTSLALGLANGHPQVTLNIILALPVILVGLIEDAGWRVNPYLRLLAGAVSSLLAILLSGAAIDHLGIVALDAALTHQALAIAFSVFAFTGVTQSFNLLDGLHGLCGLTSAAVALALAIISSKAGQAEFGLALITLAAALLGFLLLNFPRGRIFLGDAGATGIGFILACSAVQLANLVPDLSPFALALVFFWPIADTLLTIARRLGHKKPSMHPDRMHFHHVVMRSIEILVLRRKDRAVSNPLA